MMLQWMAYAALCAALFAAAAACVERVCASHAAPGAASGSPRSPSPSSFPFHSRGPRAASASPSRRCSRRSQSRAHHAGHPAGASRHHRADRVGHRVTALRDPSAYCTLADEPSASCVSSRTIAGRPAFISHDFGPAVVGVFRHHIVVPDWVLALEENEQQLVVMHELEHARSSDPLVALAGVCSVVAMPWNVALWWQLSRLRLAIEVDCDARVVARKEERNVIAYGQLLLCVRERGRASRHPALALSHSRSSLAKRLDALLDRRTRRRPAQLVGLATLALCIAASVAFIPAPRVQTVIRQLRKSRAESGVSAATIVTRTPRAARGVGSLTKVPAPLQIEQRAPALRRTARANSPLTNLTETPVPP